MIAHPRRNPRKVATNSLPEHDHNADYATLLRGVQETFDAYTADGSRLFATDCEGLFDTFLDGLPAEKQIHTCSACHRFVKDYGHLVTITEDGQTIPAMWDICPDFYRLSVLNLAKAVKRARVSGPFLSKDAAWGLPETGAWTHLSVRSHAAGQFRHSLLTPNQAMAAKREDFRTVAAALADFTEPMLREALRLLETESLNRSEKFIAPVRWLLDLHVKRKALKGTARDNVLWRAIASAPDGYCHPRASVIGSLLEDIAAGKPFEVVRSAFNAKTGSLIYQRPQAAPAAGNIAAAEKIIEAMGLAPALERRFARLEDLETIWTPVAMKNASPTGGVFGRLKPKGETVAPALNIPPVRVTWMKFMGALPGTERMQYLVEGGAFNGIAFTAPVHADSPELFKWSNRIAWYVHGHPSSPSVWKLAAHSWSEVTAISMLPTLWGDNPQAFLSEGAMLALDGCVDTRNSSNALFPECLKGELHQVRSTIEAYSRSAKLAEPELATACGRDIHKGNPINATVRLLKGGVWTAYLIDRWD